MKGPTLGARNGVTCCLAIAAGSLLACGAIGPLHALVLLAACGVSRMRPPTLPRRIWDGLACAALAWFALDAIVLTGNLIGAALRLLTFVTVHRCLDIERPGGQRQALSLSFVQMVAAAASTTESWFALLLAPYLAAGIGTLMALSASGDGNAPRGLDPETARRPEEASLGRILLMAAAVGSAGLALFFLIPHLGTGYFRPIAGSDSRHDAVSGFSIRVELGAIGRIKRDGSVAMRVRADRKVLDPESVLWRGLALDTFDGRSWMSSPEGSRQRWIGPARGGWLEVEASGSDTAPVEHRVTLEPGVHPVLFTPANPAKIASRDFVSLARDAEGALHLRAPRVGRLSYRCLAPPPGTKVASAAPPPDVADRARYTALPRIDPRIAEMADRVAGNAAGDFERARRIEDWLEESFDYTLDVDDAGVDDPLEHFLIEGRAGHCEYFATSMAVMLRHLGIPARLVTGFGAGEWSGLTASWIVRNSDAHTWVEAWIPERGWTSFDPTPPDDAMATSAGLAGWMSGRIADMEIAWDTWIVGIDLLDQQSMAVGIREVAANAGQAAAGLVPGLAGTLSGMIQTEPGGSSMARRLVVILPAALLVCAAAAFALSARLRRAAWLACLAVSPVTGAGRATRRLRRFEARWAARGFRRLPGQTPMEFALDLQAREPARAAGAPSIIRDYYHARYGQPESEASTGNALSPAAGV